MLSTFLTREELVQLTGAKIRTSQLKQLALQGFDFVIGRDGHPRVLRSAVEQRLGITKSRKVDKEPILFDNVGGNENG
ncbi:DUF4224 domain-containing protein [Thalassotalea sp. PP2-459]|uniref:DUF4224 domain-containing protein n=1 Tax=Thalassotalea sp. PP2-459 TaxID=1742724 RepID=UPI0009453E81|nr:DUF4224 domain-containing protein [Thalassotalea sp. PP2-459]OKY25649.1 hypothetical protein BI291_15580 [Thalassotalea sp. PP2-459]